MRISRITAAGLAAAALLASALPVAGQEPGTLEGVPWTLVSYSDGSDLTDVPIGVDAGLLLESGTASGSSGCNSFSGGYALEAASIDFDDALTTTLRACLGDAGDVETAYFDALSQVESWSVDDTMLTLSDFDFQPLLVFEAADSASLSATDVTRLLARIETLEAQVARNEERIDNISIGKLRERIRALEDDNATLKSQVAQLRASGGSSGGSGGSSGGSSGSFSSAERTLLESVPPRFHGRCRPLRSGLPAGTAAAVTCQPNTNRVAEMAYYLMEANNAVKLYNDRMSNAGVQMWGDIVPEGTQLCDEAVPSSIAAGGGYIGMEGCYREGGRAQLRIVEQLTRCNQLQAGSTWLRRPVMYVALEGPNADIKALHTWASRNPTSNLSPLIVPLGDIGGPDSPDCFVS